MSEKKTLSRSEVIRQRHLEQLRQYQQENQKEEQKAQETQVTVQRATRAPRPAKKQTSRKKSGYRELPPITARGVVNDFAFERRKKNGKRRFNAVLSLPFPKIRTLTLPRFQFQVRVGWRLRSLFLVLLLGTGLYLFWTLPEFRVVSAHVTGNQRFSADEINGVLGLNGYPVFLLTPARIRDQVLRNYPELASVEVAVSLPNTVTINVTERQPLILWQQDGGFTWVDETGTAFRPRGEAQGLIVVQALGMPPEMTATEEDPLASVPFIPLETVKEITALAPHVPPGTPILYDPITGLSWVDGRGWQVIFGSSSDDIEVKVRIYNAMVDWLTQRGIRPILINVAYPKAPFYRVEQVDQVESTEVIAEE